MVGGASRAQNRSRRNCRLGQQDRADRVGCHDTKGSLRRIVLIPDRREEAKGERGLSGDDKPVRPGAKPGGSRALRARLPDQGPDSQTSSGPAAVSCCANRPDTWMHPTGAHCRQKPLAPQGPSTHGLTAKSLHTTPVQGPSTASGQINCASPFSQRSSQDSID